MTSNSSRFISTQNRRCLHLPIIVLGLAINAAACSSTVPANSESALTYDSPNALGAVEASFVDLLDERGDSTSGMWISIEANAISLDSLMHTRGSEAESPAADGPHRRLLARAAQDLASKYDAPPRRVFLRLLPGVRNEPPVYLGTVQMVDHCGAAANCPGRLIWLDSAKALSTEEFRVGAWRVVASHDTARRDRFAAVIESSGADSYYGHVFQLNPTPRAVACIRRDAREKLSAFTCPAAHDTVVD